ncbi:MAG: CoA transferase, partial [Sphingobium sp.]
MSAYDFLADLLVIEVAHLGPDSLGGYLADMGARVVKVEAPGAGDQVRYAGALSMGTPDGFSFLHLRWNRGKESLGLDLHRPEGVALFKQLAARADVVIEGMRAGVLDRLGLGYEDLRGANPGLVYCSISGLGLTGPYAAQGSHGPSFDAFGGLGLPIKDSISKYDGAQPTAIGMHAMGLHAAVGVLSAVIRSRSTGKGALIEVAAAESSAHWLPDGVDTVLNPDHTFERPGFAGSDGRMIHWPRMENYRTRDGLLLYAQPLSPKFWKRFIALVERPDLEQLYQTAASPEEADAAVNAAMAEIFLTRDRADWLETL